MGQPLEFALATCVAARAPEFAAEELQREAHAGRFASAKIFAKK
ncbi:MAG TPA: hypothetical protein VFD70_04390 [Anaerolineae bacterium]|nr:hypothetical protein [Anaerolineae bacterium]